jgi:adsorption protein B
LTVILASLDAAARVLAYGVGAGIFLNALDELYVDANYFLRPSRRRRGDVVSVTGLRAVPMKRVAILVPAWHEADVIEEMLSSNVLKLDYDPRRFDIFCGTYQNDPETQTRVEAAAAYAPNVHKVVVPHDGPTSKADCLNSVYRAIARHELERGRRYDILLLHDAEDVIHPLSLRLYSALIPPNDFVQTPVFSLPLPTRRVVSGTYIDEFAEHHLKDMFVREAIGGIVPSAGVGTAFARDALEEIANRNDGSPFNTESLTEDYEIGLRFRLAGKRMHFACYALPGATRGKEVIATREFFPGRLRASVRQRSRWILGIALQTWAQLGWRGPPAVVYCLWRDRKALLTNTLQLLAYALVAYVTVRAWLAHGDAAWEPYRLAANDSLLWWLLATNLGIAVWRAAMKAQFVGRLYGPWQALLSVPRLVVGNVIGIVAMLRAVAQFARHRITGQPLRWLKTAHTFPTGPAGQPITLPRRSSHV